MPTPTICLEPGCPKLAVRAGRCERHRLERRRADDRRRPTAQQRGYDVRWQRTRKTYLRLQPVCELDGCEEPATDVDHIDGLGPSGPRGHDLLNLRALCHPHHSQRTARDQPGGWNT